MDFYLLAVMTLESRNTAIADTAKLSVSNTINAV